MLNIEYRGWCVLAPVGCQLFDLIAVGVSDSTLYHPTLDRREAYMDWMLRYAYIPRQSAYTSVSTSKLGMKVVPPYH
jgi:hypothetical protein